MKKFIYLTLFCLLCSLQLAEAHSAKALGMGDVGVAYPQDAISNMYNPANSASIGNRFDFTGGVAYTPYSAFLKRSPVPEANKKIYGRRTWNPIAAVGYNQQLCGNWSAGVVFYNRAFFKDHYNHSNVLVGRKHAGHSYELYSTSAVLAYNWRCLQIGVSLDILIARHKAMGIQKFDNPALTIAPGHVSNRGYDWSSGVGVTVGALWNVTDTFKVGVTYRPEVRMSRFEKYKGLLPYKGVIPSPQDISAGLSWRFLPCATFAFDYTYVWINRIRAASNPIVKDPVAHKLGSRGGSSFGYRPFVFYRFGLDYALLDNFIVRAGYIYSRQFSRASQAFFDVIGNLPMTNFLTFGGTLNWRCFDLDFFYVHGFDKQVFGKNAVPAFVGGGDVAHRKSFHAWGLGIGRQF